MLGGEFHGREPPGRPDHRHGRRCRAGVHPAPDAAVGVGRSRRRTSDARGPSWTEIVVAPWAVAAAIALAAGCFVRYGPGARQRWPGRSRRSFSSGSPLTTSRPAASERDHDPTAALARRSCGLPSSVSELGEVVIAGVAALPSSASRVRSSGAGSGWGTSSSRACSGSCSDPRSCRRSLLGAVAGWRRRPVVRPSRPAARYSPDAYRLRSIPRARRARSRSSGSTPRRWSET